MVTYLELVLSRSMKFSHLPKASFQEQPITMLKIKAVRPEWVTLIASAFLLTCFNFVLWKHLFEITAADGAKASSCVWHLGQ
jgi:lipid A ethanolaminephosphotransferase